MRKYIPLMFVFLILGCVQQEIDLVITLDDVPIPENCFLTNTRSLTEFGFRGTSPLQQTYVCDSSTTVDEVYLVYHNGMSDWVKSKSVKTEYLIALVFNKEVANQIYEIVGVTYVHTFDQHQLILVKGFSDMVLDTGWVSPQT